MAIDKAVDSTQLDSGLSSVANAIRTKGGTAAQLSFPSGMVTAIGNIQTGITPSGTKSITENGTHDVTQFASASVNVPQGALNCKRYSVTLASDVISPTTVVTGDSDIAAHYSDPTLCVFYKLRKNNPMPTGSGYYFSCGYVSNITIYDGYYGLTAGQSSSSIDRRSIVDAAGSGRMTASAFYPNSGGNIIADASSNRQFPAGDYDVIVFW